MNRKTLKQSVLWQTRHICLAETRFVAKHFFYLFFFFFSVLQTAQHTLSQHTRFPSDGMKINVHQPASQPASQQALLIQIKTLVKQNKKRGNFVCTMAKRSLAAVGCQLSFQISSPACVQLHSKRVKTKPFKIIKNAPKSETVGGEGRFKLEVRKKSYVRTSKCTKQDRITTSFPFSFPSFFSVIRS